LFWSPS